MLAKIKNINRTDIQTTLSDVRTLGLIVFAIIALLVTWSGIKVVSTNYELQKQISALRQENDVKKLANANLGLKNKFLETDQYLELVARKQFNKAKPGEKLLVVPKSVALSHTVDVAGAATDSSEEPVLEESAPWYERNFNAWLDFLFREES